MEFESAIAEEGADYAADGFRQLNVWKRAKALAVAVYKLCEKGELARDFGLRDQMRRAAVSVCSNIAEGDERGSNKESVRFFYIAKGSLAELRTQLEIADEVGYLDNKMVTGIDKDCAKLANMLGALINARSASLSKPLTTNH